MPPKKNKEAEEKPLQEQERRPKRNAAERKINYSEQVIEQKTEEQDNPRKRAKKAVEKEAKKEATKGRKRKGKEQAEDEESNGVEEVPVEEPKSVKQGSSQDNTKKGEENGESEKPDLKVKKVEEKAPGKKPGAKKRAKKHKSDSEDEPEEKPEEATKEVDPIDDHEGEAKSKQAKKTKNKKDSDEEQVEVPKEKKVGRNKRAAEKAPVDSDEEQVEAPKEKKVGRNKKAAEKAPVDSDEEQVEAPKEKKVGRNKKAAEKAPVDSDEEQVEAPKEKKVGRNKKASEKSPVNSDEEQVEAPKEKKVGRNKKASEKSPVDSDEEQDEALKDKKAAKNKKAAEKAPAMNKTGTNWEEIDFSCKKKNKEGNTFNLKISCWNVGGLKAWVKKDCHKYLEFEKPDIFCLQETKCNEENLPEEITQLQEYKQYWCSSDKDGYAGVGLMTLKTPINVTYGIKDPEMDEDGRCITAEFDGYYVVCVYVPNAGRKLVTLPKRMGWNEAFKKYILDLDKNKPVIICGDMNVSHNEIDLARPKNNTKNAGFTAEEREGMTDFLQEGFVDTFRHLYPDKEDAYTFWTYMANARSKNVGWRLDYFIVSKRAIDKVCDSAIRSEVFGSDHCPITLFLNI